MIDSKTCVSGNYNNFVKVHDVTSYRCYNNRGLHPVSTYKYIRPNYTGSTPAPAPIAPAISLSSSSLVLKVGQTVPVNVKMASPVDFYIQFAVQEGKVVQCDWTRKWSDSQTTMMNFTGIRAGTTKVTVSLHDKATERMLASQTVSVTVSLAQAPKVTFDKAQIDLDVGNTMTANIKTDWNGAYRWHMDVQNKAVCTASYQGSYGAGKVSFTGVSAGETSLAGQFYDCNDKVIASFQLPIKVTAPVRPVKGEIFPSRTAVSMEKGKAEEIDIIIKGVVPYLKYKVEDSNICVARWVKKDDSISLSVAGLTAGSTFIDITANDGNGQVLDTKKVAVEVKASSTTPDIVISSSVESLQLELDGEPRQITFSWNGTHPENYNATIWGGDNIDVDIEVKGATAYVTVTPCRAGDDALKFSLWDSGKKLGEKTVPVKVIKTEVKPTIHFQEKEVTVFLGGNTVEVGLDVTGYTDQVLGFNYNGYNENTFPAEAVPTGDARNPSDMGVSLTGRTIGAGWLTVYLEDENGIIVTSDTCAVRVVENSVIHGGPAVSKELEGVFITSNKSVGQTALGELTDSGISTKTVQFRSLTEAFPGYSGEGTVSMGGYSAASHGSAVLPGNNSSSASTAIQSEDEVPASSPATGKTQDRGPTSEGIVGTKIPYTDVGESSYYYEPVQWAAGNGMTESITGTLLKPNAPCPRGEVVEFMWRAMGCPDPEPGPNPFSDVSSSDSYYDAVLWAYGAGVTTGATATTFGPGDTCTRGQVVTFLWRAQGKPATAKRTSFADVQTGQYFADAVNWAVEEGITKGTTDTSFSPGTTCSRAQILTFLYRGVESNE